VSCISEVSLATLRGRSLTAVKRVGRLVHVKRLTPAGPPKTTPQIDVFGFGWSVWVVCFGGVVPKTDHGAVLEPSRRRLGIDHERVVIVFAGAMAMREPGRESAGRESAGRSGDLRRARFRNLCFLLGAMSLGTITLGACGDKGPATSTGVIESSSGATDASGSTASDSDPGKATDPSNGVLETKTINVPKDFPSVQAAVDAAKPGNLVLLAAGTYKEAVVVRVPNIVIRGVDRNTVIFDGSDEIENGITVSADGVAVENLTLRRFAFNGLLFTKAYDDSVDAKQHTILNGYRASYITAHNNGAYGVYAFFARGGLIEHTYTSGHPDSGVYVGQCKPCDAVVTDNVSEFNAIGYSGTNASGNLFIINSIWRRNRIGMTPNSQDQERLAPQGDVVIAGNLVTDNQDPLAPSTPKGASGFGIAVSGGERNRILKNRVTGNVSVGIAVTDLNQYKPSGNVVMENVSQNNGTDLAYALTGGSGSLAASGNCFSKNTFSSSLPLQIETVLPCPGVANAQVASGVLQLQSPPPDVDYRTIAAPPAQQSMPSASSAPVVAVFRGMPKINLDAVVVPSEK
jgi:hypothetical protein